MVGLTETTARRGLSGVITWKSTRKP
jgi:hypothetical protein